MVGYKIRGMRLFYGYLKMLWRDNIGYYRCNSYLFKFFSYLFIIVYKFNDRGDGFLLLGCWGLCRLVLFCFVLLLYYWLYLICEFWGF